MTADTTIETPAEAPVADAPTDAFSVPEQYADKGWAKEVKSIDDVYSQLDGAQALIGKKSIPGTDATDEQLQDFYKQIRPQTSEGYELNLPEGVEMEINKDDQNSYKDFFHSIGLSSKQANQMFQFHVSHEMGKAPTEEQLKAQNDQQDTDFDKALAEKYGDADKGDAALKIVLQHALQCSVETNEAIKALPNDSMMAMVDLVNHMHGKIPSSAEDGPPEPGAVNHTSSPDDKLKEWAKLSLEAKKLSPLDAEYDSTRAKLKTLDEEVQKLYK